MKYRSLLVLLSVMAFVSCKTSKIKSHDANKKNEKKEVVKTTKNEVYYTEQIRNDFRAVSDSAKQKFLEAYNATDKQYSILFFTQGFNGENIEVKNDNNILYKGSVLTNKKNRFG